MKHVASIHLDGHDRPYLLDADALEALRRYLDDAAASLRADPAHDEVLADLERAIGDKLDQRIEAPEAAATIDDVLAVLELMGPVEAVEGEAPAATMPPAGRRRLCRIREGQELAGVCMGIAAYTQVGADWVRTVFVLLTLVTGGLFALVYLALVVVLPVVETSDERSRTRP